MEKSSSACRLVMICTNPSKVIDPIRSRWAFASRRRVFRCPWCIDAARARGRAHRRRDTARAGPRRSARWPSIT